MEPAKDQLPFLTFKLPEMDQKTNLRLHLVQKDQVSGLKTAELKILRGLAGGTSYLTMRGINYSPDATIPNKFYLIDWRPQLGTTVKVCNLDEGIPTFDRETTNLLDIEREVPATVLNNLKAIPRGSSEPNTPEKSKAGDYLMSFLKKLGFWELSGPTEREMREELDKKGFGEIYQVLNNSVAY